MDWDDFRYFAAVAHTGSVRAAAQNLGVNPSTVTRRLDALEQRLGVVLFTRSPKGLRLTAEGAAVVQRVDLVGEQLHGIENALKGRDQRLEGRVRVALPDLLAADFLLADLAGFTQTHPGIDLEILPGIQLLDLAQAEADVVIRPTEAPPEDMVGRPLCRVAMAAYASRRLVAERDVRREHRGAPWVDWASEGEIMAFYAQLREEHFAGVNVQVRCDHGMLRHACIGANLGLGILPCYVGERDETLVRLPSMPVQEGPMLWLLTHPDLRGARRVQAFMEFARDVFAARENELTGDEL